jgi:broad specificity phosphatase PhoE
VNENQMLEIYFIRHGESVGNKENRFRGRFDFPLNRNGIRQAELLHQKLFSVKFDTVYTSPLKRAVTTAEILASNRAPVKIEDGFTNIYLGVWENMLKSDVSKTYPDLWKLWKTTPEKLNFPGMETIETVKKRSLTALNKIINGHPSGIIGVVTHRAVLKPLFAGILKMAQPYFWKIQIDTAAYSIAEYQPKMGLIFTLINEHAHLENFIREDLG